MAIFLPFLFILSLVVCSIEVDVSVPSFPAMAHYFKVEEGVIQLTIAANFLGFFCSSLFYGPLSDKYGRRFWMLVGNTFLVIGAFGCVYASTIAALLFARFIQGIGAAAAPVLVFAMIADLYQGQRAVKLISLMNVVLTTIMAGAPILGSYILTISGWRGIYTCVAALSLSTLICLCFFLPETGSKHVLKTPIFKTYQTLLKCTSFIYASLTPSLLYAAYMAFVACSSFLYIETYTLSTFHYALHQSFVIGVFAFISFFIDKIILKIGKRQTIQLGLFALLLGGGLLFLLFFICSSPIFTTLFISLFSIGFALMYPPIFSHSLELFKDLKGAASSFIMMMRALVVAASVGFSSFFYEGTLRSFASVFLSIIAASAFCGLKNLRLFSK